MPADHQHTEYKAHVDRWSRLRDAIAGEHAIRQKAASVYLRIPKLMKSDQIGAYADSALWFNATARTLAGLVGTLMRKPARVVIPKEMEGWLRSVDRQGTPIEVFITALVRELIAMGYLCNSEVADELEAEGKSL